MNMTTCPDHGPDCIWYRHNPDNVGLDLGVGDGIRNAIDFAHAHAPMASHLLPVSDGRGDYFAIGFLQGVVQAWCPDHDDHDCRGTWRCVVKVRELVNELDGAADMAGAITLGTRGGSAHAR
jgi:hypothetical protein